MKLELQLNYTREAGGPVAAAFIHGASVRDWLREIDRWGVDPLALVCLVLPERKGSVRPGGLLVVFPAGQAPPADRLRHPYYARAGKLFLPLHACLYPDGNEAELAALLLWDWQVFHPSLGFVGFEKKDRLSLAGLLEAAPPPAGAWRRPPDPPPPAARLQQVRLETLSTAEMMDALKAGIGSRPLDELPAGNDPAGEGRSAAARIAEGLKQKVLEGGMIVLALLLQALAALPPLGGGSTSRSAGRSSRRGSGNPGALDQLVQWLSRQLETSRRNRPSNLDSKRDRELQRLLRLFDNNTDEALQYALPLDSPYLSRGQAPPSARLGKRSTHFNLGGLLGGGAVDAWDTGNYYFELRQRYQEAAKKEAARGAHKKAAYIYAHLLADFSAAANVLQQGRHFREAAALYRDHLNNRPGAAACLEKGGLLPEAIDLYLELQQHEKAGDLYRLLEQPAKATACYQTARDKALANHNYLEAARLQRQQLGEPGAAAHTLLRGWHQSAQAEACLKEYFALAAEEEPPGLPRKVQEVFSGAVAPQQQLAFLNVLLQVKTTYAGAELEAVAQQLAYQVVSEQAAAGNPSALNLLKSFVPGDRLLQPDCTRFLANRPATPLPAAGSTVYQLANDVQWLRAAPFTLNEFLLLGVKGKKLHLARGNREGRFEYHSWNEAVPYGPKARLVLNGQRTNTVLLHPADELALPLKTLPPARGFSRQLFVQCPAWLSNNVLGLAINREGNVVALLRVHGALALRHYSPEGVLHQSVDCTLEGGSPVAPHPQLPRTDVHFQNGCFYIGWGEELWQVAENGRTQVMALPASVNGLNGLTVADPDPGVKIALATAGGCALYTARGPHQQMKPYYDQPFGNELKPVCLQFILPRFLVVAERLQAVVFALEAEGPVVVRRIPATATIVSVFPAGTRNHCALLEENGRLSIHDLAQEG
ncbi:hypothetical protein V9K67_13975 [Paraflavisolibacter sp. H34]|uniref:hypothetical protein n=1 Tax=Huijunlia imazamoxiresistens TaxID=3127457 RepID=UPI003015CC4F